MYMTDRATLGAAPVYTKNDIREVYASFNGALPATLTQAQWDTTAATWLAWLASGTKSIGDLVTGLTASYGPPIRVIPVPGAAVPGTTGIDPKLLLLLGGAFLLLSGSRR